MLSEPAAQPSGLSFPTEELRTTARCVLVYLSHHKRVGLRYVTVQNDRRPRFLRLRLGHPALNLWLSIYVRSSCGLLP
eukprot:6183793-Pleurochrysis_carterae.AAC.3